jgi:hypothetical protein
MGVFMGKKTSSQEKRQRRQRGIQRLRKLAEQGIEDGIFWKPDAQYAEQVYNAINRTVFNGQLTRPKIVIRDYNKNFWGECEGMYVDNRPVCKVIRMHRWIPNSKIFIRVMAHEMVHQWEFEKGPYNRMTHGKRTFWSWKPECARWGINLT